MLTLLIDNYDSFTYNLFQLLAEVNGRDPLVVRNDEASWEELSNLDFDNVVISPGPGRPEEVQDFGVCAEAIRYCKAPLLGVCLGLQGLGWTEGGRVARAPEPVHGRIVAIEHDGSPLLAGIPSPFAAVRYHSLSLAHPLPPSLREVATCDGVPMAVEHRTRPHWGVQFHPESVATEDGERLLTNFRDLTPGRSQRRSVAFVSHTERKATRPPGTGLRVRRLEALPDPEAVFVSLYGDRDHAFWLDSSRPGERGRFSFMGDASGPLAETVTYDVEAAELTVRRDGSEQLVLGSVFGYLERRTAELRPANPPSLPFEFDCGFVGYLGYELKADCGHAPGHRSDHPDAALILADRLIAFDHEQNQTYLLSLHKLGEEGEEIGMDGLCEGREAEDWLSATATRLATLPTGALSKEPGEGPTEPSLCCEGGPSFGSFQGTLSLARPHAQYLEDVETSIGHLLDGDSYEICLTNQLRFETDTDPLDLCLRLRRVNPAPFAAYLRFGDLSILSSSPERFLRVSRAREAEARPIKGTSRRGATPEEDAGLAATLAGDEKNRAENLMIVDLLRNDLGAVCEVGTVEVPEMMAVETYETVHQLVSSVRGHLRADATTLDTVRSCFPPGSMTGAPKRRTTEILDEIEEAARGVYSGAIGWFGFGGAADLSVAIRTVVLSGGRATIGAGGAIVVGSEPEREYEEMLLKAAAALRAVDSEASPASISLALQSAAAALPR
jgi:para-aminobenzoate synthetase